MTEETEEKIESHLQDLFWKLVELRVRKHRTFKETDLIQKKGPNFLFNYLIIIIIILFVFYKKFNDFFTCITQIPPSNERITVLIHGAACLDNLMFSYDEASGRPNEVGGLLYCLAFC